MSEMKDKDLRTDTKISAEDLAVEKNLYAEMQDLLLELQNDLNTYQHKLDDAMVLLSLMENRRAKWENLQLYETKLNEIHQLLEKSMDTVSLQGRSFAESVSTVEIPQRVEPPAPAPSPVPEKPAAKEEPQPQPKKIKKKSRIGDIIFYGILVVLLIGVFIVQMTSGDGVKTFMGFSAFVVKTSSMEDVYPKGSLILTQSVDAKTLAVGDDITYMASETTTITHRIISIYENFENTGARGFETQGVMNREPDANIVPAVNVVGKVIFGSKFLGQAWAFVGANWPILVFGLVVVVALSFVLRFIFKQPETAEKSNPVSGK